MNPTGEITITLNSVDRKYQYADFNVSYSSTDREIIAALSPILLEDPGFDLQEEFDNGAYTIKRMDNSQNIYIFPKSTAGAH